METLRLVHFEYFLHNKEGQIKFLYPELQKAMITLMEKIQFLIINSRRIERPLW